MGIFDCKLCCAMPELSSSAAAATVKSLRAAASNPEMAELLVKNGMHAQLVPCLKAKDEETALSAMEAVFFLSNNPANRATMARTEGLVRTCVSLYCRPHSSTAMKNVAKTVLEHLYEYASETDREGFAPHHAKTPAREANPGTTMSKVCSISAKTFHASIPAGQLQQDPFLDKKVVRLKGVISVQIDEDNCTMTICATGKVATCEGIQDMLDSFDVDVDLDDIEEVMDEKENEGSTGGYLAGKYNDPEVRKKHMLARVNGGGSDPRASLDAKMRQKNGGAEQKGWGATIAGWAGW